MLLRILVFIFLLSGLRIQAQTKIRSVDVNIPVSYLDTENNPITLGITIASKKQKLDWMVKLAGYGTNNYLPYEMYYDSLATDFYNSQGLTGRRYSYSEKLKYQLAIGDSIHTQSANENKRGFGIQVGAKRNFEVWHIPFFVTAQLGAFIQQSRQHSAFYYTINRPDTVQYSNNYYQIIDYTTSQNVEYFSKNAWQVIPQIGLELGVPLKLGRKLLVTPKLVTNLSTQKSYALNTPYMPNVRDFRSADLASGVSIQLSYVLAKHE